MVKGLISFTVHMNFFPFNSVLFNFLVLVAGCSVVPKTFAVQRVASQKCTFPISRGFISPKDISGSLKLFTALKGRLCQ